MDNLPEGWTVTSVGEVSAGIQYGYTASAMQRTKAPRFLRITDIQDGTVDWNAVPSCEIDDGSMSRFALIKGDIVFARTGATTGKSFLIGECPSAVFASYLIRLRARAEVLPEFLAFFFQTPEYWRLISENIAGNAQPNCNASKLAALPMPLPPLAEQQRIVAKVEALLARVNAARQRLAKVPAILKRFRQSVLAAACSGWLTSDWRGDHEQQADFPSSWRLANSGEAYEDARYGTSVKCDKAGLGTPVLRVPNIARGILDLSDLKYAALSAKESDALAVREGDLIVCRTNGSLDLIGKAAVIPRLTRQYAFASYLIRLRLDGGKLLPNYFHAFLSGPAGRSQIEERTRTTAGQFNLNLDILRNLQVPFPPLAEQHEIVRRVEALFRLADAIEKRVAAATARAEKLTQAILAKAFRGELVPTEAELARQEGRDYEPAAVLLERIRAERARAAATVETQGTGRSRSRSQK